MSTSIKVSWKCTCKPSTTTGWIDGDTDTIYCNSCDGVIKKMTQAMIHDLERQARLHQAILNDTVGDNIDHIDDEKEAAEQLAAERDSDIDPNY